MTNKALDLATELNKYFTSLNAVDVPDRVSIPRDEWRELFAAMTENDGWKRVPIEPTQEMWDAGEAAALDPWYISGMP